MGWARIDDGFDDHPKVLALLENDRGAAAVGLWVLCLTWAHRNTRKRGKSPGLLPAHLPRRYLGPGAVELAGLLVKEELWEPMEEGGWKIHDFESYLPSEEMSRSRAENGRKGGVAKAAAKAAALASSQQVLASSHESLATLWQTSSKAVGTTACTSVKPPTPVPEVQNLRGLNGQNGHAPGVEVSDMSKCSALTKRGRGPRCQNDARPGKRLCATHDPEKPDEAPGFDDFWAAYPRQVGKDGARATWRAKITNRGIDPARVIAAARRYAADPSRKPDYTAHPSTWINQGRYDDAEPERETLAW